MRIAYLFNALGKTGGYLAIYNFMDHLLKRGYEIFVITPHGNFKWEPGMATEILGTDDKASHKILKGYIKSAIETVSGEGGKENVRTTYELKRCTRDICQNWLPADVTVSTYCLTAFAGYWLADQTLPLYHMQHFEEVFFKQPLGRKLARATYHLPLVQMANSEWLAGIMRRSFGKNPYILNPGIDTKTFTPHLDLKEKYKDKKEWTVASYIDESRDWKGFCDAVAAMKLVRSSCAKRGITVHWKLFGLHQPQKEYDTEFEYVGKIFGQELSQFYSSADIVFIPSWYESFPLPPIEAMASGSVVVTTRYGTEDYAIDGQNAHVCLPRKPQDMAEKIISAIENPNISQSLAQNALSTALEFTWERRTDIYEAILEDSLRKYSFKDGRLFNELADGKFDDAMYEYFGA